MTGQHIFTKVYFSANGRCLHLASLEAQKQSISKRPKNNTKSQHAKNQEDPPLRKTLLNLSLFVTMHRLSERKPTRSPPVLVHRVKVSLGKVASVSASLIPISITWTPRDLFCTVSDVTIFLLRVNLFASPCHAITMNPTLSEKTDKPESKFIDGVFNPKTNIFLPWSSLVRKIRYFPP